MDEAATARSPEVPFRGLRRRVGILLGPACCIAAGLGLEGSGIEPPARWAAAVVVLMSVWWITEPVPLWATACLPLALFPAAGVATLPAVALQYVDPINFLFLGGMLIAAAMQQWGLHRRIALGIVGRVGTGPRRIVLGFMVATAFVSLWISNTAAALLMFPIGMAVLLKFEEEVERDDPLLRRFGLALMLGIAYGASIGGIGTKIGTGPNLVFAKRAAGVLGGEVDFATWLMIGLPVVAVAIPLVWLYLVRMAAPLPAEGFAAGRRAIEEARGRLGRIAGGERVALAALLAAALLWIFRKDIDVGAVTIPGWSRLIGVGWADVIGRPLEGLPVPLRRLLAQDAGDAAVAMAVGGALLLIPVARRPLRFALDLRRAARIPWGLLVLLGGGFAMAHGIEASGLSAWMGGLLRGMGRMDPFAATLIVCLVSTALTEVASNTATANILLPLLAAGAAGFGLHPAPLMFAATLSASFGFMLPAGTPPNAIAFSSGYIPAPQMARCGLVVDLGGVVLVAAACRLLAPWALGVG